MKKRSFLAQTSKRRFFLDLCIRDPSFFNLMFCSRKHSLARLIDHFQKAIHHVLRLFHKNIQSDHLSKAIQFS